MTAKKFLPMAWPALALKARKSSGSRGEGECVHATKRDGGRYYPTTATSTIIPLTHCQDRSPPSISASRSLPAPLELPIPHGPRRHQIPRNPKSTKNKNITEINSTK